MFLYTELAEYTLTCLKTLKNIEGVSQIATIHYPINAEAPFEFDFHEIGVFRNIQSFLSFAELKNYVEDFQPDKIVVSGWANKWYLRICLAFRKRSVCILTMDNHWTGSVKQQMFARVFRISLIRVFQKIWIPGEPQLSYARKLGFKKHQILKGFYSCNTDLYFSMGSKYLSGKELKFPKRILCVARYIPQKNYESLWKAFVAWKESTDNDWELWCAGSGTDFDKRVRHPAIRHLGFVQKEQWNEIIAHTGIFVLPSIFEPWAVAVHEFAAAGYPLILSSKVGAATAFLEKDNGWLFDPFDISRLIDIFTQMGTLSTNELIEMGCRSRKLAEKITPASWSHALLEI